MVSGTNQSTYKLISMEIVSIIVDPKPTLYAIKYDNEPVQTLKQLFDSLKDAENLYKFFKEHKADLLQYGNK